MSPYIRIQTADFNQTELDQKLCSGNHTGAVVTFVGRVREFDASGTEGMWLEHYPGMTEKVLARIVAQAERAWPILEVCVVHRVGLLAPGERIVFVGVGAEHRQAAFSACEFIIDYLKTEAPFWKKEGEDWVEAKAADQKALARWRAKPVASD